MNWLEISVETEAAAAETVSAILHEYGDGGVVIDQHAEPDGEDGSYHYDTARPITVTTYVPATADANRHPKGRFPKAASPPAMIHLPSGG